ncbi:BACON domain-containing protein [Streptomyces sp. t39]|uniref:BACON domain-containing protein n=1 Tax=Streptomyces sp. t39 TaxID=1828156 RepID=UPI0011CEC802|nr:hypothetical protein [Streptomyces sp. t39]TXS56279.1 hypothetical protein EAO77_09240 [Streptomyces sp. t39]
MTSSRLEPPTHTTGAHRAHRRQSRSASERPPARYEPYLDGLFTYCLSVLCDHDAATAVLGDVLAVAERQRTRCPSEEPARKAWLYALARWACLRRLAEQRRRRPGAHTGRPAETSGTDGPRDGGRAADTDGRRRAELALLAWPEAAGTTPEQREALELSVRHGLGHAGVASVLGLGPAAARELLAAAACEVERTRAALAVVERGSCPSVARLTGDSRVVLSAALRRELVRHVDDCPRCRRAAERAGAAGPWPGAELVPEALPILKAPRSAAYLAMHRVPRARTGALRFGPGGFPLDPKDHAARRDRLRARAVTTTVVATVVAAPVLALWAAYRGAPLTGEAERGPAVSAEDGSGGGRYGHYENAGNASARPDPRFTADRHAPDVSVEVISTGPPAPPSASGAGPGRITVAARPGGDTTLITLTAWGGSPVTWSLWTDASWLRISRSSGTLEPGETITLQVTVDTAREPAGYWRAQVGVDPSGALVAIRGRGEHGTVSRPAVPSRPDPTSPPSSPPPTSPGPDPTTPPPTSEPPTSPGPDPTGPPPSSDPPPASDPPPGPDTPPPSG